MHPRALVIPIAVIAGVVLFLLLLSMPTQPPKPEPKPKPVQQVVPSTSLEEVVAHNFVIPANGQVSVPRQGRACKANSALGNQITVELKPSEVLFTSELDEDVFARVWLFDQGTSRNCQERYNELEARGLIY